MKIAAIVLAGGKGTRMKSSLPKVFHKVCGKSILNRVIETLDSSGISNLALVAGGDLERFSEFHSNSNITIVKQINRLGTGDAVASASLAFKDQELPSYSESELVHGEKITSDYVLITAADTPAISSEVIQAFIKETIQKKSALSVIGINLPNPFGYGRLIQSENGSLSKIVEQKDANEEQKKIKLCNSGVILAKTELLFELVHKLDNNNAQKEYYLTDCFELANKKGESVSIFETDDYQSFIGVNNRIQLADAEAVILNRNLNRIMSAGATVHLPKSCYVEDDVEVGPDTTIMGPCYLKGKTQIAAQTIIEPNCFLENAVISEQGTTIAAGSIVRK